MEFAIQPKSMGCPWWWFLKVSLQKKGLEERESMVKGRERENVNGYPEIVEEGGKRGKRGRVQT